MNLRNPAKLAALFITALLILSMVSIFLTTAVGATTPTSYTFGRTNTGNFQNLMSANKKGASAFVAGNTGVLSEISAYLKYANTPGNMLAALYSDNAGSPGTLIAVSNEMPLPSTFSWVNFAFPSTPPITSGTTYWLTLLRQTDAYIMAENTVSNNQWNVNQYSSGFSTTFGVANTNPIELCIYGTIQVSSPTSTPDPTATPTPTPTPKPTATPTPKPTATPTPTPTPTPASASLASINDGDWYTDTTCQTCPAQNVYLDTGTTYQGNPSWKIVPGSNYGADHDLIAVKPGDHVVMTVWVKTSGTPDPVQGRSGATVGIDFYGNYDGTWARIGGANSPGCITIEGDYGNYGWPSDTATFMVPWGSNWVQRTYDFTVPNLWWGDGAGSSGHQVPYGTYTAPVWICPWVMISANYGSTQGTYTSWFSDFQLSINP